MCLIINATIILISLFIPKIYAIYYVSDSRIKYLSSESGSGTNSEVSDVSESSTFKYTMKKVQKSQKKAENAGKK